RPPQAGPADPATPAAPGGPAQPPQQRQAGHLRRGLQHAGHPAARDVRLQGPLVVEGEGQRGDARLPDAHQRLLAGTAGQDRRRVRKQRGPLRLLQSYSC
ncbi:hypothetical protein CRUP_016160, partial [Coryphaenoides rupestris]